MAENTHRSKTTNDGAPTGWIRWSRLLVGVSLTAMRVANTETGKKHGAPGRSPETSSRRKAWGTRPIPENYLSTGII
jgi:hypothetical protein